MPLYELFCIAAHNPTSPTNLRQLIDGLARQVHSTGGVVRDLRNLGIGLTLPMRMRRHQQYYYRGDHFLMTFDTSPVVLKKLDESLKRDPAVVRWTLLRQGEKLKQLAPKPHPSIDYDGFALRDAYNARSYR